MRLSLLTSILLWLCATMLSSQTTHRLQVLEYDGTEQRKPLAHVQVQVRDAPSTSTDRNGMCRLDFRTAHPGDRVYVRRIAKQGYVILDNEIIDHWYLPSDDSPIVIVMCRTELLQHIEQQYLSALTSRQDQSLQEAERLLKQRHEEGAISQKEYEAQLVKLYDEYERQLNDITNYIHRFTHIDLSAMNHQEKQVVEYIKQGDLQHAIECYRAMDALRLYERKAQELQRLSHADSLITAHLSMQQLTQRRIVASVVRHLSLQYHTARSLMVQDQLPKAHSIAASAYAIADSINSLMPDSLRREPIFVSKPADATTDAPAGSNTNMQTDSTQTDFATILEQIKNLYSELDSTKY
ncbi:MAG: hypothetical protein K6E86_03380 [Bacteroidales bacterium]|nr:hypothetical protein [Bacteroidales bacterium]